MSHRKPATVCHPHPPYTKHRRDGKGGRDHPWGCAFERQTVDRKAPRGQPPSHQTRQQTNTKCPIRLQLPLPSKGDADVDEPSHQVDEVESGKQRGRQLDVLDYGQARVVTALHRVRRRQNGRACVESANYPSLGDRHLRVRISDGNSFRPLISLRLENTTAVLSSKFRRHDLKTGTSKPHLDAKFDRITAHDELPIDKKKS